MRWLMDSISGFNEWLAKILRFLPVPLMVIICYDVIARYVFNSPTEWALELNMHILCVYSLTCGGWVLLRGGHVNVEILYDRFGLRTKAILSCITSIYFFIFVWVVLWYGWDMAKTAFEYRETSGAMMDWPVYPTKFIVPLAALLLILQGAVKFLNDLQIAITGKEPEGVLKQHGVFAKKTED